MNPNTYQQNFSVPPIQQQPSTSMQPYVQNNQGGYYQPQPVSYQHNAVDISIFLRRFYFWIISNYEI